MNLTATFQSSKDKVKTTKVKEYTEVKKYRKPDYSKQRKTKRNED